MVYKENIPIRERFEEICKDFGGELSEENYGLVCELYDTESRYDDFTAVARWIEKHRDEIEKSGFDKSLIARFGGFDTGDYEYWAEYDVKANKLIGSFNQRKVVVSLDGFWDWVEYEFGEIEGDIDFSKIAEKVLAKDEDKLPKGVECYMDYNSDWNDYELKCEATIMGEDISPVLNFDLLEKRVGDAMQKIEDDFNGELYGEVEEKAKKR